MNAATIDKIAVRDQATRLDQHARSQVKILDRGRKAGEALLWFADYAQGAHPIAQFLPKLRYAESTHQSPTAEEYLQRAADELAETIIQRAIEIAQEDFKEAREIVR